MRKIIFFVSFVVIAVTGLAAASSVFAQSTLPPAEAAGPCKSSATIGPCVVEIYKWSLGVAVLLALMMIIASGYLYITAGGNANQVSTAKELFTGAFIGLIILFSAVVILRTINPDLLRFDDLRFSEYTNNGYLNK